MEDPCATPPLRVLVVCDCPDHAHSLAALATIWGHQTRVALSGATALRLAASFRPHVVLLDLRLPDLDGCEVARRMRQAPWAEAVLLVAVTGGAMDADRRRSAEAGFDDHLVKPLCLEEVKQILATSAACR